MAQFQVQKQQLQEHRVVTAGRPVLAPQELLLKIDRFAFTANNITYGVAGDMLGYWRFFPPAGAQSEHWGVLPVWGFADVVESRCDDIRIGERFYGYFPPANWLSMQPAKVSNNGFVEAAAHRAELPPAYNRYLRVDNEAGYQRDTDELRALLYPLYLTSFCLWDALQDNNWHGASQLIIVSASSKTSIGLAYALAADAQAPATVGLTSGGNLQLLDGLGLYHQCVGYEALDSIDNQPSVIIDMSGNSAVLGLLHRHLGDNMRRTLNVGITHWEEPRNTAGLITERSEMFFAPGHVQKRYKDWGADGFHQRTTAFMQQTIAKSASWLKVTRLQGLDGLAAVYRDVCNGKISPDVGLIVEM